MKTLKLIAVIVIVIFSGIYSATAQKNDSKNMQSIIKNLTEEQKALLQEQQVLIKKQREVYKASLTTAQLAIIENKDFSKKEKIEALKSTLTDAQKKLMHQSRKRISAIKEQFRSTITAEQRKQLRIDIYKNKNVEIGNELNEITREEGRVKNEFQGNSEFPGPRREPMPEPPGPALN